MSDFESLCLYLAIYSISAVFIGLWSKRKLWIAAIIGLALPIILAALRYPVGTDFWTYLQMWDRSGLLTYEDIFQHLYQEPLFHLISKLTCNYGNEKWFFGLCAGLTLIPAIISFKKQFKGHYIALFAFLFLLTNFTGSFNIMRQYIAVSFTFVASAYIFKRDIRKFAFWIIIAMMFHLSATIFAPAYFIYSKGKFIDLKRGVILTIVFIAVLFATSLTESLSGIEGFERYAVYSEADSRAQNRSLILSAILLTIYLIKRKKMQYVDTRTNTYLILVIIAFLIEITGSITPFIKRSGLYFNIYYIVLACIWLKSFASQRLFAKLFIIVFFLTRFIIATYFLGQANIIPYNTKETYYNDGRSQT